MANSFVTAGRVSALAIPLLSRQLVLPMTVARISGGEYAGDNGDTVTVRVPVPGAARNRADDNGGITYDDISEASVTVELEHLYHATRVSDEELSLELVDFATQVTAIQVDAVARGAEDTLATVMNDVVADDGDVDPLELEDAILEARESLTKNDVPAGDRYIAHGPEVTTALLAIDKFVRVNESGDDGALRDATVGRLYGFTFVESNALDAASAVAYHRTGFAMANRAPVAPRGANDTATATAGGLSLRQIFQYAPDVLSDASVLSTFAGSNVVDADRVYKFELAASGT